MNHSIIYSWYERYKTGIYRYALSMLKDAHLAEDVLQETFLRLLTGKYSPEPGKEQAYLYRMARTLCYDILRRQKREQVPVEAVYREEQFGFIEMISGLEQKEKEIVTLKIVGGLSHKDIAKIMGMTVHACKKRYERSIQKLREMEGDL